MNLIKSLLQRKAITFFFVVAFTVGILIFSIGDSAIISQQNKLKEFDSKNNKVISFLDYEGITIEEIINILKEGSVTTILSRDIGEESTSVETILLPEGKEFKLDMKSGKSFTNEELRGDEEKGIYSIRLDKEIELISDNGDKIKVSEMGTCFDITRKVTIPNGLFIKLYGDEASMAGTSILLRGEPDEIKSTIAKLDSEFKDRLTLNGKGIQVFDTSIENVEPESNALYNAGIMIFIITIINSVSISSLWVKSRKKEIVLRKVFGAKNRDITKIFLLELVIIAFISLILALIIQFLIAIVTGGNIGTVDLRLKIEAIRNSFMISMITAFSVSLPSLKYISKIQPVEMLKEE